MFPSSDFDDMQKKFWSTARIFIVFAIVSNFIFWGGLIYFAVWTLKHFGVIN